MSVGCRIHEELPSLIKSDNFSALVSLSLCTLRRNWDVIEFSHRLRLFAMLSVISTRVESSLLSEYHLEVAFSLLQRLRAEVESQKLCGRPYHEALGSMFVFLKNLVPLHHSHSKLIDQSGFLQVAMNFVIATIGKLEDSTASEDDNAFESLHAVKDSIQYAIDLITSTLNCAELVNCDRTPLIIFPQLKLHHLDKLLRVENGFCVTEALKLFFTTFGHFITRDNADNKVNITQFLEIYLDHSIQLSKKYLNLRRCDDEKDVVNRNETLPVAVCNVKAIWESLRIMSQDSYLMSVMDTERFIHRRSSLINCIETLLHTPVEDFDMSVGIMCVDAISVLCGSIDRCWKDRLASDNELIDIFSAMDVKVLRKRLSTTGESEAKMEEIRESESSLSDDEVMVRLRCSISTLDIAAGPINDSHLSKSDCTRALHGKIDSEELVDFLHDWEVESTSSVCVKIMKLVGISRNHPLGLASIASLDLVGLSEVLIELLVDDRHGLNEEEGMQEKCMQLLTDLIPANEAIGEVVGEHVDMFIEVLSDWNNFGDKFLIQTCISLLITMAETNNTVRRRIYDDLDKFKDVLMHAHNPIILLAVLELCLTIMPCFKKSSFCQEMLFLDWIMTCLSFRTKPMLTRACQLIYQASMVNRHLISKACSRHEVENIFIDLIHTSRDKETVLLALRTLAILAECFNMNPVWVLCRWLPLPAHCKHVSSGRRVLSSVDFISDLLQLQCQFEEPFNLVVLAYSLEIVSTIRRLPLQDTAEADNYASKFYAVYMPLVAGLLAMITRSHTFCDVPEDVDGFNERKISAEEDLDIEESGNDDILSVKDNLYDGLMSMPLEEINPVYELLLASVVNALHSMIGGECVNGKTSYETFFNYAELFSSTPLCESIIYIMIQLPNNYSAQVKGIMALEVLLRHGIGARILSECCTRVLTSAIVSFVDDSEVLYSFCSIVNILSSRDLKTKCRMVNAGVHKWLYVVMKGQSPVTSPMSCHAVYNLVHGCEENCVVVGSSGILRPTIYMLEKHPDNLKVQFEGLQLICALCKSKDVLKNIKESDGEGAIAAARKYLNGIYMKLNGGRARTATFFRSSSSNSERGSGVTNDDASKIIAETLDGSESEYSKEEIKELLDLSTPTRLGQQKCVVM